METKPKKGEAEKVLFAELEHLRRLARAREELRVKDPVMRRLIDANLALDYDA